MATTLTATFTTRRDAEMTVERLVQEQGIERTDIFIVASGPDNSVGRDEAGSDIKLGTASPKSRDDAPLEGSITVSVDLEDDACADMVCESFAEFNASRVEQD